ncbi:MAG TPA: ATP-binding protein [Candidatus Binataceae bacterium]|nr:ATP-binding protein [Candidatus Binataceae bacterium]
MKQGIKTVPARRNVATRIRRESDIEQFGSLVDELSASMAQASANSVDGEIQNWLATICGALELDRSALYERDGPGQPVRTTHTWLREGFPPFPRKYDPETLFKRTTDWVMAGNQLVFSHVDEIPLHLADAKRFVIRHGPKASAIFPMIASGRVIGAASFGRFRAAREWHPRLLERLSLVVRIFGAAIERKQAVTAARAAAAELAVAQRRSIAGELVGSLAHELNQPLTAILSNLEGLARLLSREDSEPALVLRVVRNAIQDTKRAGQIVRQVRAMFRSGAIRKAALDVTSVIKEVVELVENEAAVRQIMVRIDDLANTPRALADRVQIQQCVMNLVMNALDAISRTTSGPREVSISTEAESTGWVAVRIRDTGDGVAPAIAKRLFEPFTTTKPEGMGLGLLVTRSIIESHGGRIWFTPNTERGATFTFTLPVVREARISKSQATKYPEHQ